MHFTWITAAAAAFDGKIVGVVSLRIRCIYAFPCITAADVQGQWSYRISHHVAAWCCPTESMPGVWRHLDIACSIHRSAFHSPANVILVIISFRLSYYHVIVSDGLRPCGAILHIQY